MKLSLLPVRAVNGRASIAYTFRRQILRLPPLLVEVVGWRRRCHILDRHPSISRPDIMDENTQCWPSLCIHKNRSLRRTKRARPNTRIHRDLLSGPVLMFHHPRRPTGTSLRRQITPIRRRTTTAVQNTIQTHPFGPNIL
jgi:hypothetical protein